MGTCYNCKRESILTPHSNMFLWDNIIHRQGNASMLKAVLDRRDTLWLCEACNADAHNLRHLRMVMISDNGRAYWIKEATGNSCENIGI